jgi:antitoxin component YwqK of YwqJK toxin-antitoxin module
MKYIFTLRCLALFCYPAIMSAQSDTTYLDSKYQPANNDGKGYYWIQVVTPENGRYRVQYFYPKGNNIRMQGYSATSNGSPLVGEATWYFESGQVESVQEKAGEKAGWFDFYDINHRRVARGWSENGDLNGKVFFYDSNGKKYANAEFRNGRCINGTRPYIVTYSDQGKYNIITFKNGVQIEQRKYFENRNIAMEAELQETEYLKKATYYYPNGKKIGSCTYRHDGNKVIPVTGTHVDLGSRDFWDGRIPVIASISTYNAEQILQREAFSPDGKSIASCTFQNNAPYQGSYLDNLTVKTIEKGANTGLNTCYSTDLKHILYTVQAVNGRKEGEVLIFDTLGARIAQGIYKNDAPWSGAILQDNQVCQYVEGKKSGECIKRNENGQIIARVSWFEGQLQGEAEFLIPGTSHTLKGIYKDNKPWSGHFEAGTQFKHYTDGVYNQILRYFPGTDTLETVIAENSGPVIVYDRKGNVLYQGEKRNGAQYEGVFKGNREIISLQNFKKHGKVEYLDMDEKKIRTETWVDGERDGETIWYSPADSVVARCIYRKNKPFEGVVRVTGDADSTIVFKNGQRNGLVTKRQKPFTIYTTWENDKKEGPARVEWKQYRNGKKVITAWSGTYHNDLPTNGDFLIGRTFTHYVNGKRQGLTTTFGNESDIVRIENFHNDTLDGEIRYFLAKDTLTGIYKNGQPWSGYIQRNTSNKDRNKEFDRFETGQKTMDYRVINLDKKTSMEFRNGQKFDGTLPDKNNENTLCYYKEGRHLYDITYENATARDTLYITQIHDNIQEVFDRRGHKIAKTVYESEPEEGYTEYYHADGKLSHRAEFKWGSMTGGCYQESITSGPRRFNFAEICVTPDSITFTLRTGNNLLTRQQRIPAPKYYPWPIKFTSSFIHQLQSSEGTTSWYETSTSRRLATLETDKQQMNGFRIEENTDTDVFLLFHHTGSSTPAEVLRFKTLEELKKALK